MSQDLQWREFERLIALIEHRLAPKGAIVRSPDRVADKTTGQPREVDASIRYRVGSVPILITIECRDRVSLEDVTWIEQLIAKRESIGASATIAVSSRGFSRPATDKAKAHAIETRVLKEVSDDAIRDWAEHLQLVVVQGKFNVVSTHVRLKSVAGHRDPHPHPDTVKELAKGAVDYCFIRRANDDALISIGHLLKDSRGHAPVAFVQGPITVTIPADTSVLIPLKTSYPSLFDDVTPDGTPIAKTYVWEFAPGEASLMTAHGPAELEAITVQFAVAKYVRPVNVGRLLSYETENNRIAEVEQRELRMGAGVLQITQLRDKTDDGKPSTEPPGSPGV